MSTPTRKTTTTERDSRSVRRRGCLSVCFSVVFCELRETYCPTSRRRTMTFSGADVATVFISVCRPLVTSRGVMEVWRPRSALSSSMRTCPRESHRTHAQKVAESDSVTMIVSCSVTHTVSVSVRVCSEACVNVVELLQLAAERAASGMRAVKHFLKDFGEVAHGGT